MADDDNTTIPVTLYLPPSEATALARLAARIDMAECARFAGPTTTIGGRSEVDAMAHGLLGLRGALAVAGFRA